MKQLSFVLLLTAWLALATSSQLLQLSFSELAAGGRLADIKHALREVGGLAVTGLGQTAYTAALKQLRAAAPDCMSASAFDDDSTVKEVLLEDGLRRRTVAVGQPQAENNIGGWPACVRPEVAAVEAAFDLVEQELVAALGRLLGNETLLVAAPGDRGTLTVLSLPQLAAKTHLHVYDNSEVARIEEEDGNTEGDTLSLPYHLDNGLYLLLTPSPVRPLRLRTRGGRPVRTDNVPDADDAVIFLLGRGLTDWLLAAGSGDDKANRYRHLVPALHAVPSLRGTLVGTTRTVVARMRVAPLDAMPVAPLLAGGGRLPRRFGDVFFDGEIRQSAASLCYFGGPLNLGETQQRDRRHTADCWPHTQKC